MNKSSTELRMLSSDKEHMCKVYNNPRAIIKLRSGTASSKSKTFPMLITEPKIETILKKFRKDKTSLLSKNLTNQPSEKNYKNHTPILSTALDDSEQCLKTLVGKIENMIRVDELTISRNILE